MEKDILVEFGKTLRKLRTEKHISQEAFAAICNLHRTYISDVELGKRNVSLENIKRMSDALEMNISGLFLEVENQ